MEDLPDQVRDEAAEWFARMRGPGAAACAEACLAWRSASPAHEAAWQQLQQRWEQSGFVGNLGVARNRDLSRAAVWHRRPAARTALAACLALFALIAGGLALYGGQLAPSAAIAATYETRLGEIHSIALGNGMKVTLDANSAITVAARSIELVRGRARFDIAHHDESPVTVSARGVTVTAADTAFDIDLAPHLLRVATLRGNAEVRTNGGSGKLASVWTLKAGEELTPSQSGAPRRVGADRFQWSSGMLSFDGERLDDAAAALNRYNRESIELADPALGALRITGAFHANDPRGFATAIAAMFRLTLTERSGVLVLGPSKKP